MRGLGWGPRGLKNLSLGVLNRLLDAFRDPLVLAPQRLGELCRRDWQAVQPVAGLRIRNFLWSTLV